MGQRKDKNNYETFNILYEEEGQGEDFEDEEGLNQHNPIILVNQEG